MCELKFIIQEYSPKFYKKKLNAQLIPAKNTHSDGKLLFLKADAQKYRYHTDVAMA